MATLSPMEIILIVLVVLLGGAALGLWLQRRRSEELKSRFGPEYERTVAQVGTASKAETLLHEREKRVAKFSIRPLPPEKRARYVDQWRQVQAQFVDDPKGAVTHADDLLGSVMESRGYPVVDFEQRSADLSVDHPEVVQNYRVAHEIATRHSRGEAGTEDLRQAMIHYRALFDDLVNEPGAASDHDERIAPLSTKENHHG